MAEQNIVYGYTAITEFGQIQKIFRYGRQLEVSKRFRTVQYER